MNDIVNNIKRAIFAIILIPAFVSCSAGKGLYVNNKHSYHIDNLACGSMSITAEVKGDEVSVFHYFDGDFKLSEEISDGITTSGKSPARIEKIELFRRGEPLKLKNLEFSRNDTLELKLILQDGYYKYDGAILYNPSSFIECKNSKIFVNTVKIYL